MNAPVCPVCGRDCAAPFLRRELVPVFLNRVYATEAAACAAGTGRLELAYCASCELGFNAAFDPSLVVYGDDYENEQGHSPVFARHVDLMIERVLLALDRGRGTILEVGCGQGEFLRRLAARISGDEIQLIGIDPCFRSAQARVGREAYTTRFAAERLRFLASTLEDIPPGMLPAPPVIVLSRHVIEHIPRPAEFLQSLVKGRIQPPPDRLLLETPSFEWIIRNRTFIDIFYEHCCYYTRAALLAIASRADWRAESIDSVFGGQYFWMAARSVGNGQVHLKLENGPSLPVAEVERFAEQEAGMRAYWRARLEAAARRGPVAVWGAGAKGVTFTTLLDPDRVQIKCLVDVNPAKQGRFIPLTGHPIHSVESALKAGVATAFVMNPNYLEEIGQMTAGTSVELIPVQSTEHAIHI